MQAFRPLNCSLRQNVRHSVNKFGKFIPLSALAVVLTLLAWLVLFANCNN
jgi:hypothetical protein